MRVSRLVNEKHWESLSRHCVPLVAPGGREIPNVYVNLIQRDDSEQVAFMHYYTGSDFFVRIMEYDTSKPISDYNGFGNYTCEMKPLPLQDSVDLVKQLGLSGLEDYFSALMRAPEDN